MKITDLSILCKWETLKNRQFIKYLFAPLCVCVYIYICMLIGTLVGFLFILFSCSFLRSTGYKIIPV